MKPTKFNIYLDSSDFDATLTFYRDVLGLAVLAVYEHPHRRGVIFGVNDAVELEFFGAPAGQAMPMKPPMPGTVRIKFQVPDVQAEYARLTGAGAPLVEDIGDRPWGERSFAVQAPDSIVVHIYQSL
ncbi:MAG: hypothetical protein OHK0046_10890 [Anaerolineae bacterium]